MGKHNKNRRKNRRNRTPLSGHTRQGKQLLPPFAAKLGGLTYSSWINDRLPDMLWAVIIRVGLGQDLALRQFRRILNFIIEHPRTKELSDLTITGMSRLEETLREELFRCISKEKEVAEMLSTLLIFEGLPAYDSWKKCLPATEANIPLLVNSVGATLWHQSQEATDCRWLKLMGNVVTNRFIMPPDSIDELLKYPNEGDQRKVRPLIRASEIAPTSAFAPDLTWPKQFWDEAWKKTPCIGKAPEQDLAQPSKIAGDRINEVLKALGEHWGKTHATTATDARHDAVFGMAFFTLRLLEELVTPGMGETILGRLGLRTILEVRINLRYLLEKKDEALWKKWRAYGAGQAKLNALKLDELLESPHYIDKEGLEGIVNEDIWEEFLAIDLGSWNGADLRKISEQCGVKDIYDQYYPWTSGYSHGMWGPIRETCYDTCRNPLHRLHRCPRLNRLFDTVADAVVLADAILADLEKAYPGFGLRIGNTESDVSAANETEKNV